MATQAVLAPLQSASIIERDTNGDVLWGWMYPAVEDSLKAVIVSKSGLDNIDALATRSAPLRIWGKFKGVWFYIFTTSVENLEGATIPDAVAVSSVVTSDKFSPEMCFTLAELLLQQYAQGGSGTSLLASYLSVYTTGSCKTVAGQVFQLSKYKDTKAYVKGSLKTVVRKFGIESILIYIAVLLKKRVVVVCPDVEELLELMRTLPQFVFSRQDWSILFPHVAMSDAEMDDLAAATGPYIAGFTDPDVTIREDLYDLIVDVAGSNVTYPDHAGKLFGMGKMHKEIAMYLTTAAEDDTIKETDMLRELVERTDTLLDGLNKLAKPSDKDASKMVISLEDIQARKMQASMHRFLYNLALAEGMVE